MDLPFNTLTQFVALGLTLVAGWFLGLASASGGRKWRERYYDEEMSNATYRDETQADLRDSAKRIRELEAENAKLRAGAPVVEEGHSTAALAGAAVAGAAVGAVATHAVHRADDHPEAPVAADHVEPAVAAPTVHPDDHEPALAHGTAADADPALADTHHH